MQDVKDTTGTQVPQARRRQEGAGPSPSRRLRTQGPPGSRPSRMASSARGCEQVTRRVPEDEPPPLAENAKLQVIGKPASPRLDAVEKVTGKARYTFDVRLPGMLWARCVAIAVAPRAHQVRWTPRRPSAIPASAPFTSSSACCSTRAAARPQGGAAQRYPIVRYAGQPIAAVAADTRSAPPTRRRRWSRSSYEPLPHVTDLEEAMKEDAPASSRARPSSRPPRAAAARPRASPRRATCAAPTPSPEAWAARGDVDAGLRASPTSSSRRSTAPRSRPTCRMETARARRRLAATTGSPSTPRPSASAACATSRRDLRPAQEPGPRHQRVHWAAASAPSSASATSGCSPSTSRARPARRCG